MDEWQDEVALVTGGGSGIGLAAVQAFARRGVRVVIAEIDSHSGRQAAQQVEESGGQALFIACDVTVGEQVEALVRAAVERFGRLDFAFNNAGWEGPLAPTAEYSEADWDRVVAVNLKGVWLCMKSEIRQMLKQRRGAIVNAASVAALISERGYPAYAAAKGGVLQLTRTAAVEYAGSGIRINAVCPGLIQTPMADRAAGRLSVGAMMPGVVPSRFLRSMIDSVIRFGPVKKASLRMMQPMGRPGKPEEVAEAALWLCSDRSSFVTGHALLVDGGMTAQ